MIALSLLTSNPYIPWDPSLFMAGIHQLLAAIGAAFGVGFQVFVLILGVQLVISIVLSISGGAAK